MKKIFIVILNWNQPELTINCVKSIEKLKINKGFEVKVLIVDNGSTDNSIEKLKKLESGKIKSEILETHENLGFAAGNNFGIKYCFEKSADYIMVINNDTLVDKNLVYELIKEMEEDPKIGITSPKIYFAKGYEFHLERYKKDELGKVIWYAGGIIDWKNVYGKNRGVDEVDKGQFDKRISIDFATGACFMARSEALKRVGLFNEKYFMYMEDADLSERMKENNWKIIYQPKAKLWHKVAQSSGIGSSLNDYYISRNRLMFGFKYAKIRTKIALIRESIRLFIFGRHWQAVGIRDFYLRKFGKGSWN